MHQMAALYIINLTSFSKQVRAPRAKYTLVGEAIRYVIPGHMQCSMGCGGQDCKYDNPSYWREDQQAIKGLYSSWVTDHLLAMSRPSTEIIEKYNIIDQFKRNCIKTVINLQTPGEHASCGNPLEPESGFSYRPEVLMENNIYFYNFGWNDYGVANLTTMLDMVKVMAFALQEGKVAVHCHAGLGRTGVLLACFLAYASRMTANQAILYVRAKRPNSIQTRGQLHCVRGFVQFLNPLRSVFSCAEPRSSPVTLSQYLNRQRHMLHGYERREMRHLPKIVLLVSRLLLDIAENRQVIEEDILEAPDIQDIEMTLSVIEKLGPELYTNQPRLPGPLTLPRHFNEPPIFYHRKSLSYSDSDLSKLRSELNLLTQPLSSLSQNNIQVTSSAAKDSVPAEQTKGWKSNKFFTSQGSTSSIWELKNVTTERDASLLLKKAKSRDTHFESEGGKSFWKAEQGKEVPMNGKQPHRRSDDVSEMSEVPFITLQSELSSEAKRLLVAQALAVDLFEDEEELHIRKVLTWQEELNQGGAWERLCMERDPFVLAGLMWAWLEQLKEPVISIQAVKALNPKNNSKTVLDTLDQAPKETLMCILDCMAHMRTIPEEVEIAFLDRTIKAFTQKDRNTEEGRNAYSSMTTFLRCALLDMRHAVEEDELIHSSFPLP
ncbi:protein tyrosine phosphatase domain-containing protein 1 [Genypterus blacodes]|uniref:protein tyrosine phosphatase domain-containing protein 1 n=1 Tax=Genypterus blacodes TaxID=154954 RepID=UPI003F769CFC